MDQLEGEVSLQLAPHPAEDQLDLDAVADHHAQQVVDVPRLSQTAAMGLLWNVDSVCSTWRTRGWTRPSLYSARRPDRGRGYRDSSGREA